MSDECKCRNLPDGDHFASCFRSRYNLPDRMATMLRRLEWAGVDDGCKQCPLCGARGDEEDHVSHCDLAALLRDTTLLSG